MIDPTEHTVSELEDALATVADRDVLEDALGIEQSFKDRKTAKAAIRDRIEALETGDTGVQVDTSEPADPDNRGRRARRARSEGASHPPDPDEIDPATDSIFGGNEVPVGRDLPLVVVSPPHEGMFAGYWFERGRRRVVTRDRRVDDAIVAGDLDYRYPAPEGAEDGEYL